MEECSTDHYSQLPARGRSGVRSKLFVPTASQINGKWVKEKKEPEKKWNTTLLKGDVRNEELTPLPISAMTKKFENVQSKLLAPTAASIHGRHPSPVRGDSPSKQRAVSPAREGPIEVQPFNSPTLHKPTAATVHAQRRKLSPDKHEKSFLAGKVSPVVVCLSKSQSYTLSNEFVVCSTASSHLSSA